MLVSIYTSVFLSRKTNDAFLQVAQAWGHEQVKSPRLIFAVIEMESDPVLADVFELESFPSLVYLSESHDISKVCEEWCVRRRFLGRTVTRWCWREKVVSFLVRRSSGSSSSAQELR